MSISAANGIESCKLCVVCIFIDTTKKEKKRCGWRCRLLSCKLMLWCLLIIVLFEFVVICCFVGWDEGFRGVLDCAYVFSQFVLEFVACVPKSNVLYHIKWVCFKVVQVLNLRWAFSRLESECATTTFVVRVVLPWIVIKVGFPSHALDDFPSHGKYHQAHVINIYIL